MQTAAAISEKPKTDPAVRILVVDDEAFVRESLVAYLEDSGYQLFQAVDGEDGLRQFQEHMPDLVLCDLRMPRMDGLTVLRKVHEMAPDTPVIVVSGAGVISDVVEALRLGASDYLIKPIVDLEVLEHAVGRSLERSRLRAENRRYRQELEAANRELAHSLELLRVDQQAGREVQMNMLPPNRMTFGGYQFTHSITPSLYLSGDFVDYFPLSDRYVLFYIADVSGHGASSAFVTVLLKNLSYELMRQTSVNLDEERLKPSRILRRINDILLQVRVEKHMTTFLGILDLEGDQLRFSMGGHFPYPVLFDGDQARVLEYRGLPVGLFGDAEFTDRSVEFNDRSGLVLFSDGILEILDAPDLASKEDMLRNAVALHHTDAGEIAGALGVDPQREVPDDIAILTLSGKAGD